MHLPEEITGPTGLAPVEMNKLKELVILAGRNGSGKSRLLSIIKENYGLVPDVNRRASMRREIEDYERQIEVGDRRIDQPSNHHRAPNHTESAGNWHKEKLNIQQEIKSRQDLLESCQFGLSEPKKDYHRIVHYVPKSLELNDSYSTSMSQLEYAGTKIFQFGVYDMHQLCFPAIQSIINDWNNARLLKSDSDISEEEFQQAKGNYDRLQEFISKFLNTKIGKDPKGHATIFGKRLGEAKLSDGQKVLIQFAIALYGQEAELGESIIFMDEPENHLHPAALIEVIDKIHQNIGEGQLWIATHSVHVLAHFDSSYTWYIEDGKVSYAGSVPQKVLKGLLGNEDEIDLLSNYLSLPAKMASDAFAYQCLLAPGVSPTNSADRQTTQMHNIIRQRLQEGQVMKVLDYGVGKGRLLGAIAENDRLAGINTAIWLDYYGFDLFTDNAEICQKTFAEVYGDNGSKRYFNTNATALGALDAGSFDFIVMCNVLHEIQPDEWVGTFSEANSLMSLLKPDTGVLMIVEDQLLAVGEKAHSKGFLVLDTAELKKLFGANGDAEVETHVHPENPRLKAHLIPTKYADKVNDSSRKNALCLLQSNAKSEIKNIRSTKPDYKAGKLHSFWTQQFANASLALG